MRHLLSPRSAGSPRSTQPTSPSGHRVALRELWLRRGTPSGPETPGTFTSVQLSELGHAAARETFLTETVPFAAAWTNLFQEMLADSHLLKWRENGPGVGRDARIAYSGLLGRYMARAYLTVHEGVRELIPLDEAKRRWEGTAYCIRKHPRERGHEADWIGRDDRGHMVIAEAKGSFDTGVRTWSGPAYRPEVLQTAIDQAGRTAIFKSSRNTPLRAKRWAIASRWSNECNQRTPTLLAWDPDEGELERGDYRELAYHLRRADVEGVMAGLGHHQAARVLMAGDTLAPARGALHLRVGSRALDHGYAALVGPVGIHPLRNPDDLDAARRIRELNPNVALASLSTDYADTATTGPASPEDAEPEHRSKRVAEPDDRFIQRDGLTVAWPNAGEEIAMIDD